MTTATVTRSVDVDPALISQLLGGNVRAMTPDADGLAELFRAWCRTVPYDTTMKLAGLVADPDGPLWGLEPSALLDAALRDGTGGTCFPLAAGFAAVARSCGFDAQTHIAQPCDAEYSDHAISVVSIDGTRYLCDPAFLHLHPATLPTRDGQRVIVGPRCSPIEVTLTEGAIAFAVQRGTSTAQRWYRHLDRPLTGAEIVDAYEVAGRWAAGMRPYLRFARGAHQIVIDANQITTKGPGGLQIRALQDHTLLEQLASATRWVGEPLELLAAQIAAARRGTL